MLDKGKKRTRKKAPPAAAPMEAAAPAQPSAPKPAASPVVARPPAAETSRSALRPGSITSEQRRHMIAEAAYFRAQRRGFRGGDPDRDWIEAEVEIDALLLDRR
jgi:hypothetical protein